LPIDDPIFEQILQKPRSKKKGSNEQSVSTPAPLYPDAEQEPKRPSQENQIQQDVNMAYQPVEQAQKSTMDLDGMSISEFNALNGNAQTSPLHQPRHNLSPQSVMLKMGPRNQLLSRPVISITH